MKKNKKTSTEIEKINPVHQRWKMFLDYLYSSSKWNITDAYQKVYNTKSREICSYNASRLLSNEKFKEFHRKYLREIKGINEENILHFWHDKLYNAKKEENSLRASENLAKYLGMLQNQEQKQAIQVNVILDENQK